MKHKGYTEENPRVVEYDYELGTERLNQLTDFVCSMYGLSYAELADELGVNRGWFTRMRNGGFCEWRYGAVIGLIGMATRIDRKMLFKWVCVDQGLDIASGDKHQASQ